MHVMPDSPAQCTLKPVAIAHPLDEFYARSGRHLPPIRQLLPNEVPPPYHSLLVHKNDMTSTLENFHGSRIHLDVVSRDHTNGDYFREVVLRLDGSNTPVEFGAIKINLDLFPRAAYERILQQQHPLGRILKECGIVYGSRPQAFLRITSDALVNQLLNLPQSESLYGRRNTLFDPQERPLAEIVEILPPVPTP
jgi:chorismate-pyruvate lyase